MWLCKRAGRDLRGFASDGAFSAALGWETRGRGDSEMPCTARRPQEAPVALSGWRGRRLTLANFINACAFSQQQCCRKQFPRSHWSCWAAFGITFWPFLSPNLKHSTASAALAPLKGQCPPLRGLAACGREGKHKYKRYQLDKSRIRKLSQAFWCLAE